MLLQLGHVLSDMVSGKTTAALTEEEQLQLGHVLSDMVSLTSLKNESLTHNASIGPCPFRHGKAEVSKRGDELIDLLQLGHVLSDMVSARLPSPAVLDRGRFNWAMSFQTW